MQVDIDRDSLIYYIGINKDKIGKEGKTVALSGGRGVGGSNPPSPISKPCRLK